MIVPSGRRVGGTPARGRTSDDGARRADRRRSHRAAASWYDRRLARAGDRRAVRDPAAGRPRRPGDQGRAARRRRLRPRLRPPRRRPELALRLDQPQQGVARPRRQGPTGTRGAAAAAGDGRRVRAEPRARRRGPDGVERRRASGGEPAAGRLRHLRLRPRRAVRVDEGLRPHGAERGGAPVGHRHGAGDGEGGDLRLGHRRRHVRLQRCAGGAAGARHHRKGLAGRRVDARGHRRMDGLPALLRLRRVPRHRRGRARRTRRSTRTGPSRPATARSS